METLLLFPQRQHESFRRRVLEEITRGAKEQDMRIEDYIHGIYFRGDDPPLFRDRRSLLSLYQQFRDLIENAVSSAEDAQHMKRTSKVYLCYRIYLHAMTLERQVMSEADAREMLLHGLREYFYARGRILKLEEEMALLKAVEETLYRAPELGAS